MPDRLRRGLLPAHGLRVALVRVGDTARMARVLHGLAPTAARLFAEALAAGALLGALEKDRGRVNLQVECDGPIGGLLVDADADGNLRGYVKRPAVYFPGDPARGARAALGGAGFLSVIRDRGEGHPYRSAVELRAMELAGDLRRWFEASEQVGTALDIAAVPRGSEPLGDVAALLVQRLPDGDAAAIGAIRARLAEGALAAAVGRGASAEEIVRDVAGGPLEVLADHEIAYRCGCGPERARSAVSALGASGIDEVIAGEGQAVITCEFCRQRYVVDGEELREIARRLRAGQARP
jgi:molecular chaperone Hsp33